ncbi:hypothetical protein MCUN1_000300 [Malassezia cuniculi]|uniref:Uncharacterized protein n=1 Tax=Malassezia cuniculi TaxID=948313 RepID=A0AAF0EV49_9BASI|nr:hypothetical protein MCUN1_000300 [Malassezia cuniculi]
MGVMSSYVAVRLGAAARMAPVSVSLRMSPLAAYMAPLETIASHIARWLGGSGILTPTQTPAPLLAGAGAGAAGMLPAPAPESAAAEWNGILLAAPKKKVSHSRKAMRMANKGLKDRTTAAPAAGVAAAGFRGVASAAATSTTPHADAIKRLALPEATAVAILTRVLDGSPSEAHIFQALDDAKRPASALRRLASQILQLSQAKERYGVSFQLYRLAHRRGDADAGYSWATMVLEGLVPDAGVPAQDAVDVYVRLAKDGHAQAKFGLGRVLLAQASQAPDPAASVERATALWHSAGRSGMPDAWYELGRLHMDGTHAPRDEAKAISAFEHGARAGSSLAAYALGVLHSQRAEKGNAKAASLSTRYFLRAAQKGHAPSAYNMGVRYLGGTDETREAHHARWGVYPDDKSARQWFAAAAGKNYLPAIMNYAAMLADGRGGDDRIKDLREAQQQYRRAEGLAAAARHGLLARDDSATVASHMQASARAGRARVDSLLAGEVGAAAAAATDDGTAAGAASANAADGASTAKSAASGGTSCIVM